MRRAIFAATVLVVSVGLAQAGIRADLSGDAVVAFATTMDMPFVTVGNPGNAGELSGAGAGGYGPNRICGAVDSGKPRELLAMGGLTMLGGRRK